MKILPSLGLNPAVTRERVQAEVELNRAVCHANVLSVLDFGTTDDGEPYLVTEALQGETLGERLRREGRLPLRSALELGREVARGLAAVHRAGVVHRDVKPDNLFLCDERAHGVRVKVLDFGFAASMKAARHAERNVLGTLEYIAPEQALAEAVDGRADLYALGVVLFRAVTGELPFDTCAKLGILTHHLLSPIPPPSWLMDDLEPAFEQIILAAVRKHPDNRYASMEDLLDDLDRALAGGSVRGAPMVIRPDAFRPTSERGRRVLEAIARG